MKLPTNFRLFGGSVREYSLVYPETVSPQITPDLLPGKHWRVKVDKSCSLVGMGSQRLICYSRRIMLKNIPKHIAW